MGEWKPLCTVCNTKRVSNRLGICKDCNRVPCKDCGKIAKQNLFKSVRCHDCDWTHRRLMAGNQLGDPAV